jgi:MYXO-CTERM domain-containing protein
MHLPRTSLGDDATGDPNITTDSSGMSVVTVTATDTALPWWAWLALLAAGVYWMGRRS